MAGGIFIDQPFHPNPKCIVFAAALMISYWFLPNRNPFLLPLIFIVGYIAMAWYDHLYNCDYKLSSGTAIGPNTITSKQNNIMPKPSSDSNDFILSNIFLNMFSPLL